MEEEKINLEQNNEIIVENVQENLNGGNANDPKQKKKTLTKIFAIIVPSVLILVGCIVGLYFLLVPREKTFSYLNMQITLTTDFVEKSNINFSTTFQSDDMIITVAREKISELEELTDINEDSTCSDYLHLLVDLNDILSYVRDENGLKYIEYYKTVSDQGYYYRAYAYKYDGAFWLIQMICFSEDRSEFVPSMQKYAASVKFIEKQSTTPTVTIS